MDLMDVRREMMGVIASMAGASNIVRGSFVGDDENAINVQCPFKPDIAIVFSNDLRTNPGISTGGLVSLYLNESYGLYNTMRYVNATSGVAVGGAIENISSNYQDGVYTLYSQSGIAALRFLQGYTYEYTFIKL